jgi:hypothetical protein
MTHRNYGDDPSRDRAIMAIQDMMEQPHWGSYRGGG